MESNYFIQEIGNAVQLRFIYDNVEQAVLLFLDSDNPDIDNTRS